MVTCNGQWCVGLLHGAGLRNTIDSFMAIIRHFKVARETEGDGCQSALWDCFKGSIFNMAANSSPKTVPQCTLTTMSPGLPRNLNVTNYDVAEETGLNFVLKAIPQCNLTRRTNNRSGVTLKGFHGPERVLYKVGEFPRSPKLFKQDSCILS